MNFNYLVPVDRKTVKFPSFHYRLRPLIMIVSNFYPGGKLSHHTCYMAITFSLIKSAWQEGAEVMINASSRKTCCGAR